MARRRKTGKTARPEQAVEVRHAEPEVRHATPEILTRVALKCPRCGSVRSRLLRTRPGADGRMEERRCRSCLAEFHVWDPEWRP